jgi:hypothetical protein
MYPIEYNFDLTHAILEEMEPHLLSPEVFWPISRQSKPGMPPFPRQTIGRLLLTLDQLAAQEARMSTDQAMIYQKILLKKATLCRKWAVAIELKSTHEMRTRLNLWGAYLTELEDRTEPSDYFANEVRNRVIFQRLTEYAAQQPDSETLKEDMTHLDSRLRLFFVPGVFIWDQHLQDLYPSTSYWFLYGLPRTRA